MKACWAKKLPMANPHAVVNLLDCPECCDPALCVIWGSFRQMRRYHGHRPAEVPRVFRLVDLAAADRPGHGPVHLLLRSASEGRLVNCGLPGTLWRKGGFGLDCLLVLISISRLPSLMLGGVGLRVSLLLVRGFVEGHFWILRVPGSLFSLPT